MYLQIDISYCKSCDILKKNIIFMFLELEEFFLSPILLDHQRDRKKNQP